MKHVLITGTSGGFGWSMVERFLSDSQFVIHATTRSGQLPQADTLSLDQRSRLKLYSLDYEKPESVHSLVSALSDIPINILINNAGYGLFGALEDLSEDQIRKQMEINFFGAVLLTRALLPQLRTTQGHVVNFSSVFGFSGFPFTSLYCASKFALEGWSEALRFELKPFGVRVSVVQPGAHRTKFGAQVEWGQNSFSAQSVFRAPSTAYRDLLKKLMNRPNPQRPETVAEGVYRLVTSSSPSFRKRFGKDAQFNYWLRRMLPLSWILGMSDRLFHRVFSVSVKA